MLLDQNTILSDAQAITTTAASTNTVDLTAAGNVVAGGLFAVCRTDEAFAGATGVQISLQTSDTSAFSSVTTLLSATFAAADLAAANKMLMAMALPFGLKRYVRAYYTVTGTATAGKLSFFLTDAVDAK